jgi:hypothetical protein
MMIPKDLWDNTIWGKSAKSFVDYGLFYVNLNKCDFEDMLMYLQGFVLFFFAVLRLELRAYTLIHYTSLFLW